MAKNMAIKKLLLLTVCLFFSSCSSSRDTSNIEKVFDLYKNRNKEIKIVDIPEAKLAKLTYDIIEIRTSGILKQGVFLSMTSRQNYKNFTSGMGQIVTMNGAIVSKTLGMDIYLNSVEFSNNNPFDNYTKIQDMPKKTEKQYRFLLPTNKEKEIIFTCEIKIKEKETIVLLEKKHSLNKVIESCNSKQNNHRNIYWIDNDGYVWKSRQWISNKGIYADVNVLKKLN